MADSVLLEPVLLTIADGIAWVTLNRPDAMNAINYDLLASLPPVLQAVADDTAVACVVLTGAGKAFSAGGDLDYLAELGQNAELRAKTIAREVARQVREELTYPGQIRITVVRESRATEFAR